MYNDQSNFSMLLETKSIDYPKNFSFIQGLTGVPSAGFGMGVTGENSNINISNTFNPEIYYDLMEDFSFLDSLINAFATPISEILDKTEFTLGLTDTDTNTSYGDACIIINNFFKDVDFKSYIKNNLKEIILRGGYLSYLDYPNKNLDDTINPYMYTSLVKNGRPLWITPSFGRMGGSQVNSQVVPAFPQSDSGFGSSFVKNGFPSVFFTDYYYSLKTVSTFTREQVDQLIRGEGGEILKGVFSMKEENPSYQLLRSEVKTALNKIRVSFKISRPKSFFEPFLKDLFTLNLKRRVTDILQITNLTRNDILAMNLQSVEINSGETDRLKNALSSLLNKFSQEFIRTYENPTSLLTTVLAQLTNRIDLVPVVNSFSDISVLNIPDHEQKLQAALADVQEMERRIAGTASVPEEILTGSANRWEAMARNEKYMTTILHMLASITNFVKRTAVTVYYNHTNENYWRNVYTEPSMSRLHENQYETHGILLNSNIFSFKMDSSTQLDAYVSKPKTALALERVQAITNMSDAINLLLQSKFIDPQKIAEFLKKTMYSTDNTADESSVFNLEKIKKMAEENSNGGMDAQDPNAGYALEGEGAPEDMDQFPS